MSEPSLAQTPSLEELKAQEEGTISEIRAKIEDLKTKVPKNYTAADIILKKITGQISPPGETNPTKRAKYFDELKRALAIQDEAKQLAALRALARKMSGKPDDEPKDDDPEDDTDTGDEDDEQDSADLRQNMQDCLNRGGSWGSNGCSGGSSSGYGTQGNGSRNQPANNSGSGGGPGSSMAVAAPRSSMGGGGGDTNGGGSSTDYGNGGTDGPPPPNKELADGSGTECGYANAKVTAYGYTGDHTPDSASNFRCTGGKCTSGCGTTGPEGLKGGACGMGNRSNLLTDNHSFAVSKDIVSACGLKVGDTICVNVKEGQICGIYEDTSPQKNNVDRYLPNVKAKVGNSYFHRATGRILKLKKTAPIKKHPCGSSVKRC
ncbi:MAG: hypothetical protein LRY76_08055 [Alphaproteobacteria bacterium]|nr:hypothetical protein [Alphaproteobacteria bacterium]